MPDPSLSACSATSATRGRRVAQRRVELADQRAHPVRVVRPVAQLERRPRAQLEPAGRRGGRDRAPGRLDIERARLEEGARTGERERGVRALVAGGEQALGDREVTGLDTAHGARSELLGAPGGERGELVGELAQHDDRSR